MSRAHRALAALVPEPRNQWVLGHAAELETIDRASERRRWRLGLVPLFIHALVSQLVHDPKSFLGGALLRTAAAASSAINIAASIGLAAVYYVEPIGLVLALALVLALQGGYTAAHLAGVFRTKRSAARLLQLAGSAAAFVVGTIGLTMRLGADLTPGGDPEYGPTTVALLIAGHGLVSLLAWMRPCDGEIAAA